MTEPASARADMQESQKEHIKFTIKIALKKQLFAKSRANSNAISMR